MKAVLSAGTPFPYFAFQGVFAGYGKGVRKKWDHRNDSQLYEYMRWSAVERD